MSTHTTGRITFKADGDANHYSMLTEDGRWWMAVLANGEQTSERQIANLRRLAACWNACEGISTEYLETTGLPEFAGKTLCADMVQVELDAMTKQRDQLQQLVDAQVQDIGNGMALLHRMKVERDKLLYALQMMLERIPEPPEANCSCHLSPPCNDCIEYGGEREAFESAKEAIAAVKGGEA